MFAKVRAKFSKPVKRLQSLLGATERNTRMQRDSLVELQRLTYIAGFPSELKPLACYAESNFSQNGEDGVIAEIFRRLGLPCLTFAEIGGGDGTENNSIYLLLGGARGLWVEGSAKNCAKIRDLHRDALATGTLQLANEMVTAENVNAILAAAKLPEDLDFLSIDIDGNDYWVWKAIDMRPKVVAVEYNPRLGSSLSWTMAYNPSHAWPGKISYFGASLAALEKLGREKGYTLVGCDFFGVNAFFVRADLLSDRFPGPHTANALFQPCRASLGKLPQGKQVAFGPYVNP